MEREINLEEVTDGKRYQANDLVKVGCMECAGCSSCCKGMGDSIVLDPYDIYQLEKGLQVSFEQLLATSVDLRVVEGMIIPCMKLSGKEESCTYLNDEGRCSIHAFRPGFCRLFPLGRIYENGGFEYILQVHECQYPNKSKVKVKKWLDIPQLKKYEEFVLTWHDFRKELQEKIFVNASEEELKKYNLYLLQVFFMKPYDTKVDFYEQFEGRMEEVKHIEINKLEY